MAFDGVDLDFEDGLFDASDEEIDIKSTAADANTAPAAAVDTQLGPLPTGLDDLIVGGFEAPSPATAVTDHDEPRDAAVSSPRLMESLDVVEHTRPPSENSGLPDGPTAVSDVAEEPYRSPALATTVSVPRQALDSVELMFDDDVDDSEAVGDGEISGAAAALVAAGSVADAIVEAAGRTAVAEEAGRTAEGEEADVIADAEEAGELGAADTSPLAPEPDESAWAATAAASAAAGAAEGGSPAGSSGSSPDDPRARRRLDGEESATSERSKSAAARRAATRKGSSDGGGGAGGGTAVRRRGSPRRGVSPRMASRPVVRARPAPSPPPAAAPTPAPPAAASDGSVASAVFVSARVRPQTALEVSKGGYPCVAAHAGGSGGGGASGISVGATSAGRRDTLYAVHRAFGAAASQADVYAAAARPVVRGVLRGFNGAILAYGQTGRCVGGWEWERLAASARPAPRAAPAQCSGKTYTMFGPHSGTPSPTEEASTDAIAAVGAGAVFADRSASPLSDGLGESCSVAAAAPPPPLDASAGVIPRAVHDLFDAIAAISAPPSSDQEPPPASVRVDVALTVIEVGESGGGGGACLPTFLPSHRLAAWPAAGLRGAHPRLARTPPFAGHSLPRAGRLGGRRWRSSSSSSRGSLGRRGCRRGCCCCRCRSLVNTSLGEPSLRLPARHGRGRLRYCLRRPAAPCDAQRKRH